MSLTVTVESESLRALLERALSLTNDLSPIMSAAGMEMESLVSGRFESESDPDGNAWRPWAESTKANYPKDGNRRLLDCFGDMLGSLTHTFDQSSALIGFGDPKAAYHEWKTERMPRRGLLFSDPDAGTLSATDVQSLEQVIVLAITQELGAF